MPLAVWDSWSSLISHTLVKNRRPCLQTLLLLRKPPYFTVTQRFSLNFPGLRLLFSSCWTLYLCSTSATACCCCLSHGACLVQVGPPVSVMFSGWPAAPRANIYPHFFPPRSPPFLWNLLLLTRGCIFKKQLCLSQTQDQKMNPLLFPIMLYIFLFSILIF